MPRETMFLRLIAALLAFFVAAPASAQDWWVAETDHFIVKSRDSEANTRNYARQLERFDRAMRTLQNLPLDDKPQSRSTKLTVYRFGDSGQIGNLLGSSSVAGFFMPRAGDSVAFVPVREDRDSASLFRGRQNASALDAGSVMQHEYTHYFMMQHFPAAYPSWYVEGYAETMATLRLNDDGSFHIGDPPQYRARQVLEMRQFPLQDMLDSEHEPSPLEYYQFYGTGWLLTHYLSFDPARAQRLREYLVALSKGENSLAAARRVFGDVRQLQRAMLDYRDGPFPGYDVRPPASGETQPTSRPLTAAEVALLREEMRLRLVEDLGDARDMASDARRKVAGHEHDYGAMLVVARAEALAGNFDEAERLASGLTDSAPDRPEAWLLLSDVAIERIAQDSAQATRAREHASKAAALDRADPRPQINYYRSYVEAGEEPPEAAIIALESVFEAAAMDSVYRLLLTRQLLSESKLEAARTVLLPIAFRGHASEADEARVEDGKPTFAKLLSLADAGDRTPAIAMIDALIDEIENPEDD